MDSSPLPLPGTPQFASRYYGKLGQGQEQGQGGGQGQLNVGSTHSTHSRQSSGRRQSRSFEKDVLRLQQERAEAGEEEEHTVDLETDLHSLLHCSLAHSQACDLSGCGSGSGSGSSGTSGNPLADTSRSSRGSIFSSSSVPSLGTMTGQGLDQSLDLGLDLTEGAATSAPAGRAGSVGAGRGGGVATPALPYSPMSSVKSGESVVSFRRDSHGRGPIAAGTHSTHSTRSTAGAGAGGNQSLMSEPEVTMTVQLEGGLMAMVDELCPDDAHAKAPVAPAAPALSPWLADVSMISQQDDDHTQRLEGNLGDLMARVATPLQKVGEGRGEGRGEGGGGG